MSSALTASHSVIKLAQRQSATLCFLHRHGCHDFYAWAFSWATGVGVGTIFGDSGHQSLRLRRCRNNLTFERPIMKLLLKALVIVLYCATLGFAAPQSDERPSINVPGRPCGPQANRFLSRITPQGWKGADFRSHCAEHDECYYTVGSDRPQCDHELKQNLISSCESSRRPRQCKRIVRTMHWIIVRFGQSSFDTGQKIAAQ